MGLFSRKKQDDGIIDLGDGNVLVSPERQDELAEQTVEWVADNYDQPVAKEVSDAVGIAVENRHRGEDLGGKLKSLLAPTAIMGYAARRSEDGLDAIRADTPLLAAEFQECLDEGASTAEALADVALTSCDLDGPQAAATFEAIDGLDGIRDRVCEKTAVLSARVAVDMGLAEEGELPKGVDAAELLAAWRSGYLIRSCEQSLSNDVDLTADTERRVVLIDVLAVEEACGDWAEQHPDASEEEMENAAREILQHPRFRVDAEDLPGEDDGVERYSLFEVDHSGNIVPQSD
jgi:hypothetical protein